MKFDWGKLWEAAKEPLRVLVLAVIPVILAYFELINKEWAVIIVALLRVLDKYLHLQAPKGTAGGLTRF
jgi:hypothetical protein